MSDIPNTSKTLEVKIRALAGQERQDQKDLSRVFLSRDALLELRLEAGQPCYLWKMDEESAPRREAIAWPSAQKLNKNVLQMFKTFQEICDFRLEDRIGVAPAGKLLTPDCILLRDSSNSDALQEKDRTHWEWFLEDKLSRFSFYIIEIFVPEEMSSHVYQVEIYFIHFLLFNIAFSDIF